MYAIFITNTFEKELQGLGSKATVARKKLLTHIVPALKQSPYLGANIKKLKGFSPDTWRYRIGDYRIFYSVEENTKTISLLTISHRREAY